ncbi:MAG: SPOR domain-containing protein [Gammaproteobacteria bacterium]|nr:SPOR domain-containing protein [Gammaproteobacteria bacterium]
MQFGAYTTRNMARREARRLREAGLSPIHVMARWIRGEHFYLVRQGPARNLAEARQMAAYAGRVGLGNTYIVGH